MYLINDGQKTFEFSLSAAILPMEGRQTRLNVKLWNKCQKCFHYIMCNMCEVQENELGRKQEPPSGVITEDTE